MLFLKPYDYNVWLKNVKVADKKESTDIKEQIDKENSPDVPPTPTRGGDEEEVKEENGLKLLTSNKLSTRLRIWLAQIKAAINSNKLKNTFKDILCLLHWHKKSPKRFTTI